MRLTWRRGSWSGVEHAVATARRCLKPMNHGRFSTGFRCVVFYDQGIGRQRDDELFEHIVLARQVLRQTAIRHWTQTTQGQ